MHVCNRNALIIPKWEADLQNRKFVSHLPQTVRCLDIWNDLRLDIDSKKIGTGTTESNIKKYMQIAIQEQKNKLNKKQLNCNISSR